VADHAHDALVEEPEMERAVAALREAAVLAEELTEEPAQLHAAGREDPEVAVHGQDPVAGVEGGGDAHRDGLLAHAREPLRQLSLAEQQERLVLDETGQQDGPVELLQAFWREAGRVRAGRRGGHVAHAVDSK
jgi:hypothetical protein